MSLLSILRGGQGDLLAANNLSDVANAATARSNLGAYGAGDSPTFGTITAGAINASGALDVAASGSFDNEVRIDMPSGQVDDVVLDINTPGGGVYQLRVDDTDAANPSFGWKSSANQAHYWQIGGTERLRLDANGTLLAHQGTTGSDANAQLYVFGSWSGGAEAWSTGANDRVRFQSDAMSVLLVSRNINSARLIFADEDARLAGVIQYDHATDEFGFTVGGATDRAVIDASGNIFDGTTRNVRVPDYTYDTSSRTLVLADAGRVIRYDTAGDRTLTVPPDSSVAFERGTMIRVLKTGAGTLTIARGAGVAFQDESGTNADYVLGADGSRCTLEKVTPNVWFVTGINL